MINQKNRHHLFWILQTSGWLFYLAVMLIMSWVRGNLTPFTLVIYATAATAGFLVTSSFRYLYRRIKILDSSIHSLSLLTIISSLVGANLVIWISNFLRYPYSGIKALTATPTLMSYLHRVTWWFVPLLGWNALYLGIRFWQEWVIQKERTEKAHALTQAAQLQMFRYRMNPHFLFNTLNSIRALISENKTSAKQMVTELSEYLRYSLDSKDYLNVPLKNEIEAIQHYFAIQKKRYEDKLEVRYDIEPQAREFPVLSFLIHPLVENALKYGMRTSPMPLTIHLKAKIVDGALLIDVCNTGKWLEPAGPEGQRGDSTSTGLNNVRHRLENAFPNRHRFETVEKEGKVHIQLEIRRPTERSE